MKKFTLALSLMLSLLAVCSCGGGSSASSSVAGISREIRVDDPVTVHLFDTFALKDDDQTVAAAKKAISITPKVDFDVQVVDPPTLPEKPIKPRKLLTVALSVILGMLLGGGIAVGDAMLNRTITTEKDVDEFIGLSVLGVVPEEKSLAEAMAKQDESQSLWQKVRGFLWKK